MANPWTDLASAATADLGSVTSTNIRITGTTNISNFGSTSGDGDAKVVRMAGALTLINSANLILPGSANITTLADDTLNVVCLGSGAWIVTGYKRANGKDIIFPSLSNLVASGAMNLQSRTDVASAATTSLGTAGSNFLRVTGTTTITSFGTGASGSWRMVVFAGQLTLTHNATSLILPGAANITTAANDAMTAIALGAGNWMVTSYQQANGKAVTPPAATDVTGLGTAATQNTGTSGSSIPVLNAANTHSAQNIFDVAAGAAQSIPVGLRNSGTGAASVALDFDPGGVGVGVRGAQIAAKNNGSNAVTMVMRVANGAAPADALTINPDLSVTLNGYGAGEITTDAAGAVKALPLVFSDLASITGLYGLALETAPGRHVRITNPPPLDHNIASFGTVPSGERYTLTFANPIGVAIDNDKILGPNAVGYAAGDGFAPPQFVSQGFNSLPCQPGDVLEVISLGPIATGGATRWQVLSYQPWHLYSYGQQGLSGSIASMTYTYAIGPRGPSIPPPPGPVPYSVDLFYVDGLAVQWQNGETKVTVPSINIRGGNDAAGKMFFQMGNSIPGVPGSGGPNSPLTAGGEMLPVSDIARDGTKICFQAMVDDPARPGHLRLVGNDVGFFTGRSPSYLSQGFTSTINAKLTEVPSVNGTGGTLTVEITKKQTTTPILRFWWDDIGNVMAAGCATLEAATPVYGAWPYDTHYPTDPNKWPAPSGDCDHTTQGWGNVSVVLTDINSTACRNNAGIAMRTYGAHGNGLDWGWDAGLGQVRQYRVYGGTRTAIHTLDPSNGAQTFGEASSSLSLRGTVLTPDNSAFLVRLSGDIANVTGAGGDYAIPFDAEMFDRAGNYASSIFTAPVTGIYEFRGTVGLSNVTGHTGAYLKLVTTTNTYVHPAGALVPDAGTNAGMSASWIVAMSAGDTARLTVNVTGSSANVGIRHGAGNGTWETVFGGSLVG